MLYVTDEIANGLRSRHIFTERGCGFEGQGFLVDILPRLKMGDSCR